MKWQIDPTKNHWKRFLTLISLIILQAFCSLCSSPNAGKSQADRPLFGVMQGPNMQEVWIDSSSSHRLLFTAVDAEMGSGALLVADSSTGEIRSLMSGLSGDPVLLATDQHRFVIADRRADRSQLQVFSTDLGADTKTLKAISQPLSTDEVLASIPRTRRIYTDPHDAIWLSERFLVAAYYSNGVLALLEHDADNAKLHVHSLIDTSDWDLFGAPKLNPTRLLSNEDRLYVFHEGLSRDERGRLVPDDSQQIFVLEFNQGQRDLLRALDADAGKPGVQGKSLRGSAVFGVGLDEDGLVQLSLCSVLIDPSFECSQGMFRWKTDSQGHLDFGQPWQTVGELDSSQPVNWLMNGMQARYAHGRFYAQVEFVSSSLQSIGEQLARPRLGLAAWPSTSQQEFWQAQIVYNYADFSGGYYALATHPQEQVWLALGERGAGANRSQGRLTFLEVPEANENSTLLNSTDQSSRLVRSEWLELIPYNAVWLSSHDE